MPDPSVQHRATGVASAVSTLQQRMPGKVWLFICGHAAAGFCYVYTDGALVCGSVVMWGTGCSTYGNMWSGGVEAWRSGGVEE